MSSLQIKVPGKLYIAGEYSIMKPGNQAIVVSINRFIHFEIKDSLNYQFESEQGTFTWTVNDGLVRCLSYDLFLAQKAIKMAFAYLYDQDIEPKVFSIFVSSELDSEIGIKYGFGSSGAIVVGLLKTIFSFHELEVSDLNLFKLAVLTQIEAGDVSSGGDLAASVFTGWLLYQRYDLTWLVQRLHKGFYLLEQDWPSLHIEKLDIRDYELAVGWTKKDQSSSEYLEIIGQKAIDDAWYQQFLIDTRGIVSILKEALIEGDDQYVHKNVAQYRQAILNLQTWSQVPIESEILKELIETALSFGLAAKISGAGFGDCGIALLNKEQKDKLDVLYQAWKEKNIEPIDVLVWEKEI